MFSKSYENLSIFKVLFKEWKKENTPGLVEAILTNLHILRLQQL